MKERDLIKILEDLDDDEFAEFKWHLGKESWNGIEAIKKGQLAKAERRDAVDLMVQKFQIDGAVQVMLSALESINRNDLVTKLQAAAQNNEGSGPAGASNAPREARADTPEAKLVSVRSQFVDRVSEPVLRSLLDKLLEQGIITESEMESAPTVNRAEKARYVIDMVRRKGPQASSALITALIQLDPCLSGQIHLT